MIIISENRYRKNGRDLTPLEDAMRETLWPLEAFYRTLDEVDEGSGEIILILETLLRHALTMQHDLIEYLESKVGKIDFIYDNIGRGRSVRLNNIYLNTLIVRWPSYDQSQFSQNRYFK